MTNACEMDDIYADGAGGVFYLGGSGAVNVDVSYTYMSNVEAGGDGGFINMPSATSSIIVLD